MLSPGPPPGRDHLAVGADTGTWLTGATESRASSAAGRSSASEVGLWEQTAFVAFWEEPQAPARSGSRKTALEVLLVMGSHQGKKRLSWRGLYRAVMVVVFCFLVFFLDKGSPCGEVLDEAWCPTLQGWRDFLGLNAHRKGSFGAGREKFLFFFFLIFFCESSLSLRELKACFRGRPGLASHQHFNDRRDNHSGCSFYSRNYGVPHNTGLPASSCAPSRSSNRGSQSHPPPLQEKKH